MAKQSGLNMRCLVSGYDLSGDIGSISTIHGGNSPLDVTGIDKSAYERIGGRRDGEISFDAFFNPSANQAHPRLSTLPTSDVLVTVLAGVTIGNASAACVAKQVNYDGKRGQDGSLTFSTQALANGYGVEWGDQLTAGTRTDTAATNGTSFDGTAATNFGLQAYLHVTAFTGTDVTIKIQDSADNVSFADLTGGAFTQVTSGPTSQRIATSSGQTVRRYLRVATVTTGGFTSVSFQVTGVRNQTSVVF